MTDYYVDPVNGLDTNAGTPLITDAWKSFQKALDTVTAGNDIYLMNTGTEAPLANIDVNINASSITSPIRIYGADSNGDRLDGAGKYTISAAIQYVIRFITITTYMQFHDIVFSGATSHNIYINSGTPFLTFVRCNASSATTHNVQCLTTNGVQTFIDCGAFGAGSAGFNSAATANGNLHLYACEVHDNGTSGIAVGGDFSGFSILRGNRVYDNAIFGVLGNAGLYLSAVGNTLNGNVSAQLSLSTPHCWIFSNSFTDGGSSGINFTTNPAVAIDYNHYDNNTSTEWGGTGAPATTSNELNKQTGDPLFTSVVDGSEDFTPLTGSPLLDNALASGRDIGAIEMPGAGGSSWWQDWA